MALFDHSRWMARASSRHLSSTWSVRPWDPPPLPTRHERPLGSHFLACSSIVAAISAYIGTWQPASLVRIFTVCLGLIACFPIDIPRADWEDLSCTSLPEANRRGLVVFGCHPMSAGNAERHDCCRKMLPSLTSSKTTEINSQGYCSATFPAVSLAVHSEDLWLPCCSWSSLAPPEPPAKSVERQVPSPQIQIKEHRRGLTLRNRAFLFLLMSIPTERQREAAILHKHAECYSQWPQVTADWPLGTLAMESSTG